MIKQTLLQKKVILPVIGVALSAATLFSVSHIASAQSGNNFQSGLVQKIAQTFGLDQSKVQTLVDQYHQQNIQTMQQNMTTRRKQKLDQLVIQGKITVSQEQAIITEIAKLQSEYNPGSFKTLTQTQRQTTFQNMQNEVKSWAQAQGIDPKYLMPFGKMGMRRGWIHNPSGTPVPTDTPTATPSA